MSESWAKANGCEVSYNWDAGETSYCASAANGTGPFKITLREQDVRTIFKRNRSKTYVTLDLEEFLKLINDRSK